MKPFQVSEEGQIEDFVQRCVDGGSQVVMRNGIQGTFEGWAEAACLRVDMNSRVHWEEGPIKSLLQVTKNNIRELHPSFYFSLHLLFNVFWSPALLNFLSFDFHDLENGINNTFTG